MPGLEGSLGDGQGDWRVLIFAEDEISVMTLLESDSGALANLSTAAAVNGEIDLFPSSAESSGRGVLSIASRSLGGDVTIRAVDDAGQNFGPVTLSLEADRTVTLDANELEVGNGAKGLPTGLGRGEGNWRLSLESDLDLDIVAYARTGDEMLAAVHDAALHQRSTAPCAVVPRGRQRPTIESFAIGQSRRRLRRHSDSGVG